MTLRYRASPRAILFGYSLTAHATIERQLTGMSKPISDKMSIDT